MTRGPSTEKAPLFPFLNMNGFVNRPDSYWTRFEKGFEGPITIHPTSGSIPKKGLLQNP